MSEKTENEKIARECVQGIINTNYPGKEVFVQNSVTEKFVAALAAKDALIENSKLKNFCIDCCCDDLSIKLAALRKERDFLRKEIKDCISWLGEVEASNIRFVSIGAKAQRLRFERCLTPRQEDRKQ